MEASTTPESRGPVVSSDIGHVPHAPAIPHRIEASWEIPKNAGIEIIQSCALAVQNCLASEIWSADQSGPALVALPTC